MIGRLLQGLRRPPPPPVPRRLEPLPLNLPFQPAPLAVGSRPGALTAGQAFTPTQPKPGRREMVGRDAELQRILHALLDERAHVVLYTERGRGKTTLANLVIETLRQSGVMVARHTCEAGSTFDSILRGLAQDLPPSLLAVQASPGGEGCEAALPQGDLRPRDVVALMSRLACRTLVCVVDEFDRIADPGTRTRLADAIKQLSDQAVPLLFMVVGVSENLEQILGQHPSIQRNLVAVQLPLLADADVQALLANGAACAGCTMDPAVAARAAALARGSPYMAQLLGLRMVQSASRRGVNAVTGADLESAAQRLAEDAPQRIGALHAALVQSDPGMARLLRALAAAPQDQWGRFRVMPSFRDGVAVGTVHIGRERWERLLGTGAVQPVAGGAILHTFADRGLMHHILLLGELEARAAPDREAGPADLHVIAAEQ